MGTLKSLVGIDPSQPDEVTWGLVKLEVLASDREFAYRQRQHTDRTIAMLDSGDRAAIDRWFQEDDKCFEFAKKIRRELIDHGWTPAKQTDGDFFKSKEESE